MSCIDGSNYQCSGSSVIRSDNGVTLTSSGVQAYGKSTSDLVNPIADVTKAFGLTLASGGLAEIRLMKDSSAVVSSPAMLLSNLGIFWNGKTERPQIVETFRSTQARVQLDASGALTFGALPDSANLGFYDFANKGPAATQANYANNVYFPRINNPSRCDVQPCASIETAGLRYQTGDWRTGGITPDLASIDRVHNDGDIHAGNNVAGSSPIWLPGGNGIGVPFPGSKGIRALDNWSLRYSNLSAWLTQDTVEIWDWGASNEHNKIRRGIVAFGDVSSPAAVPATGSATYSGFVYGWYGHNTTASETSTAFRGAALATVNFATHQVLVTIQNTVNNDGSATTVPIALQAATAMGDASGNTANYLTGPVDNGTLKGGLSGRYFGPVVATGTSGAGPAEIGGSFSLSNATTGVAVVGGFIAGKQ